MIIPAAIFFINADISDITKNTLKLQLSINEVLTDIEFDARVQADPNYSINIHLNNLRILVIRQNLQDYTNRELADVVLFIKQGLATVLKNNFGPPTLAVLISHINIFNLLNGLKNTSYPLSCRKCCCGCCCNCFSHLPIPLQNMLINKFDCSGVHNANCDNQYNNIEWINRN